MTKEGNLDPDLKERAVENINRKISLLKDLTKYYNSLDKFFKCYGTWLKRDGRGWRSKST
jgi:hypothetical protein